jgi:hypothetical protein
VPGFSVEVSPEGGYFLIRDGERINSEPATREQSIEALATIALATQPQGKPNGAVT